MHDHGHDEQPVTVRDLIRFLSGMDPDAEVERAVVAPIDDSDEDITVDRYPVSAVVPHLDDEDGIVRVWVLGGEEEEDVESLLEALDESEGSI